VSPIFSISSPHHKQVAVLLTTHLPKVRAAIPCPGLKVRNVGVGLAAVEAAGAHHAVDAGDLGTHEIVEKLCEKRVDVGMEGRYSLVSHGETSL
jgi:hypothetical protein